MSKTVILPSGRTLVVTIATFTLANKLKCVVAAELLRVDVSIEGIQLGMDIRNLPPGVFNSLKNAALVCLSSKAIEDAVFECAAVSTIEGAKVDRKFSFNDPEARGDFLPTGWEVMIAHVAPFFAGVNLSSLIGSAGANASPPSE